MTAIRPRPRPSSAACDRWPGFAAVRLDSARHELWLGRLPPHLKPAPSMFEALWRLHPREFHEIRMHGRIVKTPRWQQAFGADYFYAGRVNRAVPIPPLLSPLLDWARAVVDSRLNALLVNWYEGPAHYIGPHRDDVRQMIPGAPIVTISLGETRTFRLRPRRGAGRRDFEAGDAAVFIMPYATNLAWTHEVLKSACYTGRRISVTSRAFG